MTQPSQEISAGSPASPPSAFSGQQEWLVVGLFSLLATVRILLFSAAFPFFNNVDEAYHFDLLCRYSHGEVPRGLERCCPEAAKLIALYETPEYIARLRDFPSRRVSPPVWSLPSVARAKLFGQEEKRWLGQVNREAVQPPFYYLIAGGWYNLGKLVGLEGGRLLYWTRSLNVAAYFLLVWLSYLLTKALVPNSRFLYLGVPLLLVVLPQNVFCGLNNDAFSAPLGTLSLYLLLRIYRSEAPHLWLAVGTGLAAAAAFLTKFTNAPILVILGAVVCLKLVQWRVRRQPLAHLLPIVLCAAAAGIPAGCWLARNYLTLDGDLTGFVLRSRFLHWTPKPLARYWNHPIFTPGGLLLFWNGIMTTLWRGEVLWHAVSLAAGRMDLFYFLSSTVFPLAFVLAAVAERRERPAETRSAAAFCLPPLALYVALLVLFSLSFDFSDEICDYPSPRLPYFTQGRLILGALVPFLIMYLGGLDVVLRWLGLSTVRPIALIVTVLLIACAQTVYMANVFASQYNWFHLR